MVFWRGINQLLVLGKMVAELQTQPMFFPPSPRAIVFVVDSVAFQREVKDVAEFLYQVLVDSTVLKNAPALLIACNKQGIVCWGIWSLSNRGC